MIIESWEVLMWWCNSDLRYEIFSRCPRLRTLRHWQQHYFCTYLLLQFRCIETDSSDLCTHLVFNAAASVVGPATWLRWTLHFEDAYAIVQPVDVDGEQDSNEDRETGAHQRYDGRLNRRTEQRRDATSSAVPPPCRRRVAVFVAWRRSVDKAGELACLRRAVSHDVTGDVVVATGNLLLATHPCRLYGRFNPRQPAAEAEWQTGATVELLCWKSAAVRQTHRIPHNYNFSMRLLAVLQT